MSSTDPPPSYNGTTDVSEKPIVVCEKPAKSTAYHLTLERCKRSVLLPSGRKACSGTIEDSNVAITISDNDTWLMIREEIWRLYQKVYPAYLGTAKLADYCLGASMQYTAHEGGVFGRVQAIEGNDDALWVFLKRDDISIINLISYCSPREGEAPGEIRSSDYVSYHLQINGQTKDKKGVKGKHHCILQ
ncbi:hypothetical protein E4T48_04969 [Aureobasidium sp. EXF-10727]|nr:hypothetical protein E4T48_04969 [Aureobasidium sp. EXF-10727]KAI4725912.1 hypothetical protein E4T49_06372 [Aureobasidium sp. EXF-10728]